MIRVGIIGMGKMGRIRYDTIAEGGHGRVVAATDPDPLRLANLGDIRLHSTASELIANPDVQAVFVCTPNYLNQPLTIQALRNGKHVFCEKPPAFTGAGVEEVIAAEATAGKKLMYGFNHRHHESILKAKQIIDSGVYGRILWMRGRYGKSVEHGFYNSWRAKRELAGGGIMLDQGIHMLDLFLMMAGDFDEVHAFVSNLYWKLDVEDNVFATLRNKQGVVASLHSTMTQWRHLFSLEIFLERGSIIINGLLTPSGSYGAEAMTITKNRSAPPAATWTQEEDLVFEVDNSWRYEIEHFLHAIQHDAPIEAGSSRDALKLMRLMDRIYENR
ncbi:MAG TPA: Gfo/Idh/MocA family oxidoreductase [Terriglobia bacterium]|nr:Gfo/Idh/MocA family oxidoreductase [Terriglobia bacterium]